MLPPGCDLLEGRAWSVLHEVDNGIQEGGEAGLELLFSVPLCAPHTPTWLREGRGIFPLILHSEIPWGEKVEEPGACTRLLTLL